MKKSLKNWIVCVSLTALVILGILAIPNTWIPLGKAVLHYKDTTVELAASEALLMRMIFSFKLYDPGIGGCPFQKDIAISFGDTVYAIATDDCPSAKNWDNTQCIEFNRLEFSQIVALFNKYCGDTPID